MRRPDDRRCMAVATWSLEVRRLRWVSIAEMFVRIERDTRYTSMVRSGCKSQPTPVGLSPVIGAARHDLSGLVRSGRFGVHARAGALGTPALASGSLDGSDVVCDP